MLFSTEFCTRRDMRLWFWFPLVLLETHRGSLAAPLTLLDLWLKLVSAFARTSSCLSAFGSPSGTNKTQFRPWDPCSYPLCSTILGLIHSVFALLWRQTGKRAWHIQFPEYCRQMRNEIPPPTENRFRSVFFPQQIHIPSLQFVAASPDSWQPLLPGFAGFLDDFGRSDRRGGKSNQSKTLLNGGKCKGQNQMHHSLLNLPHSE